MICKNLTSNNVKNKQNIRSTKESINSVFLGRVASTKDGIAFVNQGYFSIMYGHIRYRRIPMMLGVTTLSVYCISKRLMLSRAMQVASRVTPKTATALPRIIPVNEKSEVPDRPYATYNLHKPDNHSLDPKSQTNNPPIGKKGIRHPEIHRKRCDQPGCIGKVCIGLCGNMTDRKAVAHGTHSKSPPHETDKVTVSAAKQMNGQDLNGQPKTQNLVFYHDAHDVNSTPVLVTGSNQIQSNIALQELILKHEDTK